MSYIKAEEILPQEIIELIQEYIDGQTIYIPRKSGHRADWGTNTPIRQELQMRNAQIYADYCSGISTATLAEKYFLSEKSIQRIINQQK